MTTKQAIIYSTTFEGDKSSFLSAPDKYSLFPGTTIKQPSKEFVISRDKAGNTLSCYGDNTWDFNPYIPISSNGTYKVHFEKFPISHQRDSKWLVFILLYMVDSGRATGLTANSVLDYMKPIRSLVSYSEKNNIKIYQVLNNEKHLVNFTLTLKTKGKLKLFAGLLSHLGKIGVKRTGIEVLTGLSVDTIRQKAYQLEPDNQNPVIPPRIFSELVQELNNYTTLIFKNLTNIEAFIKQILTDKKFARCQTHQRKLGFVIEEQGPFFDDSAEQYKLDKLFKQLEVHSLKNLSAFITKTQHACKLIIHIYTGMRNAEVSSLKVGCLKKELVNGRTSYQLLGDTSKLIGQEKKASWVTCDSVIEPIKILESLALIIASCISLKTESTPLLISSVYLGFVTSFNTPDRRINTFQVSLKCQEVYSYLDMKKLKINQNDIKYLEKIDPFRAWNTEKSFKIGVIWRFTAHQFRRSLAYYVLQSGLVSLPTLKRQLKHISREMTLYYSQAHELENIFDKKNHISHTIRKLKPEVDALAYLHEVLLSDESLFGAGGKFIESNIKPKNNLILLKENRKKLVIQFKRGELAYKVTPLGACMTIKPCNEKATREIASCISCDRAIIKLSKLNRVIELQKTFVEELKLQDCQSIEFRTETSELNILKTFRNKIAPMENN